MTMIAPDTDAQRLVVREHQDSLRLPRSISSRRRRLPLVAVLLVWFACAGAAHATVGSGSRVAAPEAPALPSATTREPVARVTATRAVAIDVGGVPTDVEAWPGAVWVSTSLGTLVRVDPRTNRRIAEIRTGGGSIVSLAHGLGALWAIDVFGDRLLRIDPRTDRVERELPVDGMPSGLAVGHGLVWVASQLESTVAGIDPSSGRVVKLARFARGELWPGGLAVGHDGVWVITAAGNEVSVFDPATMTFVHRLRVPGARTIVTAGRGAWVGVAGARSLTHIVGGRTREVDVGVRANGYGPNLTLGGCLWSGSGGTLTRLDPSSGGVLGRLRVPKGAQPDTIAVAGALWGIDPAHRAVLRLGAGGPARSRETPGCYALPVARASR